MTEPAENLPRKDLLSGLLFLALGGAGAAVALGYPAGTASRMGPGYFPLIVSVLLIGVGLVLVLKNLGSLSSFLRDRRELNAAPVVRSLAVVLVCVLTFALLIERAGLAITSGLGVALAYFGARSLIDRKGSVWEGVIVALALSAFSVIVFVYGIGLPMRIWPR